MTKDEADLLVPLVAEQLEVTRQERALGGVRVLTRSEEHVENILLDLRRDDVEVERVAIGRQVAQAPQVRQEGEVTIVPIMEETIVVERRLILKEEVRIRRVLRTERHEEQVVLRREHAEIQQLSTENEPVGTVPAGGTKGSDNGE